MRDQPLPDEASLIFILMQVKSSIRIIYAKPYLSLNYNNIF